MWPKILKTGSLIETDEWILCYAHECLGLSLLEGLQIILHEGIPDYIALAR